MFVAADANWSAAARCANSCTSFVADCAGRDRSGWSVGLGSLNSKQSKLLYFLHRANRLDRFCGDTCQYDDGRCT